MLNSRNGDLSRRGLLRLSSAAALLALPAFSSIPTIANAQAPGPTKHTVVMANMSFGKPLKGVKVGDTIVWINRDTVPHTATARDKSFDVRIQQGQTVTMVVKKAGNIPYYCIYHPAMRGTLAVAA